VVSLNHRPHVMLTAASVVGAPHCSFVSPLMTVAQVAALLNRMTVLMSSLTVFATIATGRINARVVMISVLLTVVMQQTRTHAKMLVLTVYGACQRKNVFY